jgi:Sulfotransferase family
MPRSYVVSRVLDFYPNLGAEEIEAHLAYSSFASINGRFVYMAVPKAACTTIKEILRNLANPGELKFSVGSTRETRRNMLLHTRENIPIPPITALNNDQQRELLEASDVLRFTVVRNPYDRLISSWRDKVLLREPGIEDVYTAVRGKPPGIDCKNPIRFDEFVSFIEESIGSIWDPHWRRQVELTFVKAFSYNHIGKVEYISETFEALKRQTKRPDAVRASHRNSAMVLHRAEYSFALATRVYTLYQKDFVNFGYDKDSWPRNHGTKFSIPAERVIDELMERNLIIEHLYDERDRLRSAYRFSLLRLFDKLRGIPQP